MLEFYAGEQGGLHEVPSSGERISATGPFHPFYTPSILDELDELVKRLPPAWEPVSFEPGGNNTQAFRPGTKDPTISTALSLDSITQDKDGRDQSDTAPAANAAMSTLFEDIVQMVSMLKEEPEGERAVEEGEETPETGRGNERPLSEDDNMSIFSDDPAGGQNIPPAPRINNTGSSDVQARPGSGALPQAQSSQAYPPVQASFGNVQPTPRQPTPHQPTPRQPTPYQPTPYQPWRHQSLPPQYLPYLTPGETPLQLSQEAAAGFPPPQPYLAPPQPLQMRPEYEGYVNQVGNYGLASGASMYVDRGSFASTAYGGGPLQAPAYPQLPSQNSSEGGPQTRTPANPQFSMRPRNAAHRVTTVHRDQGPANYAPSPRMSLPPNTNAPTQRQVWNRQAAGRELEALRMGDPRRRHTGSFPQSRSDFRPRHPSQLGPPMGTVQPQHAVSSQSHEGPQRRVPLLQPTTGSDAVVKGNQQMRVERREPAYVATDVPRVTTPEAEHVRNSLPSMRGESISNIKVIFLASRIADKQKRGHPYSGLPEVTAEDIQEFRLQYRSMPVFAWSQELAGPDDRVKATLQAMKHLGFSLAGLWQLRQPTGPAQSASGTQTANPTQSAQLPGTTQPADDGHVPEYLLDQFMEILELSGEQEALRFLRESKAKAARESQRSDRSQRKRRNAMPGMSDESHMSSMDRVVDGDLSAFGITQIQNAGGQIMVAGSSRRRENANSSPALNRIIEIHIDDDLVGAAESTTPVEKFRRLMNSSPTQTKPKKKAKT